MRFHAITPSVIWFLAAVASGLLSGAEPSADKADAPDLYRIWAADKKVGFIDKTGQVVIEPQFNWAYEFSEGMCQVMLPGKEGYIDATGKLVIEIDTHDDRPFRCGVAVVCTGKRTGILDRKGNVIDCPFDWMEEFSEGLSAVAVYEKPAEEKSPPPLWRQRKWGFVDTSGNLVIPIQYTAVGSFSDGLAPVYVGGADLMCTGLSGGKWGYINREGQTVIKPQFKTAASFSEGLAVVSFDDVNYGWIDTSGKFAIKLRRLTIASSFHDGVARIRGESGYVPGWNDFGYITKGGEVFLHPVFDASADPFSEGLAGAREKPTWDEENKKWIQGKWGYVDKQGNWMIHPQFTHVRPFRGGIARVQGNRQLAYIDKTARVIWSGDLAPSSK